MKPKAVATLTVAFLLVTFGFSIICSAVDSGSDWHLQTVKKISGIDINPVPSLAMDPSGNLHVSFCDGSLKCASLSGSAWSVNNTGLWGSHYGNPLVFDSKGNPLICFYSDGLRFVSWTGSEWRLETVDDDKSGGFSCLVLDSKGYPHISYGVRYGGLKYAFWSGSGWVIQVVDNQTIGYSSLALDSSGNPHICYVNEFGDQLKYASWTGSSWRIEVVDTAKSAVNHIDYPVALALDSMDNPHICYEDWVAQALCYAGWVGSGWDLQVVDYDVSNCGRSLVFDSAGNLCVSYTGGGYYPVLKYATNVGSQWNLQNVTKIGEMDSSGGSFLVLDNNDNPFICFLNTTYLGHGSTKGEIDLAYINLPSNHSDVYLIGGLVVAVVTVVLAVLLWLKKTNR
jgi:hypothetical protein